MRIIAGKYKGSNLFAVPGNTTRPTTDYNREVIFSVMQDYDCARVLDLFAGTGSFGLEALSRGAEWVDFVEFASAAIGVLLKNITKLRCAEQCHVHRRKVEAFLKDENQPYDIIFLDPPYGKNLINPTVQLIIAAGLVKADGLIIAEHSPKEKLDEELQTYLIKQKATKITAFSILCPTISVD